MSRIHACYPFIVCSVLVMLLIHGGPATAFAQDQSPDARAFETEQQMTDDERFSMIISLLGAAPPIVPRDQRIPEGTTMSAGYTPGVPRLGIPALHMSDASLGVTNPGYRPDDKGATALPASLVVGASFNPKLARDGGNGSNFEYYSEDPLVIAFGIRVEGEGFDLPDLTLPWGQDAVIEAVASVNPNTLVVLDTGNAVVMPWRSKVKGII